MASKKRMGKVTIVLVDEGKEKKYNELDFCVYNSKK